MFFTLFIAFVILQRLFELLVAKRNEKIMLSRGAIEFDRHGFKFIVLMHTCFFISMIAEYNLLSNGLNEYWTYFIIVFAAAQVLRYWSIFSLGNFWNTKIIVLKGSGLIKKGPYKFFKRPNYAAVVTELAVIPLIFSCYITFIIFSILNLFVLHRRIRIEEEVLRINNSHYASFPRKRESSQ